MSRKSTMTDLVHRLLATSDPLVQHYNAEQTLKFRKKKPIDGDSADFVLNPEDLEVWEDDIDFWPDEPAFEGGQGRQEEGVAEDQTGPSGETDAARQNEQAVPEEPQEQPAGETEAPRQDQQAVPEEPQEQSAGEREAQPEAAPVVPSGELVAGSKDARAVRQGGSGKFHRRRKVMRKKTKIPRRALCESSSEYETDPEDERRTKKSAASGNKEQPLPPINDW